MWVGEMANLGSGNIFMLVLVNIGEKNKSKTKSIFPRVKEGTWTTPRSHLPSQYGGDFLEDGAHARTDSSPRSWTGNFFHVGQIDWAHKGSRDSPDTQERGRKYMLGVRPITQEQTHGLQLYPAPRHVHAHTWSFLQSVISSKTAFSKGY